MIRFLPRTVRARAILGVLLALVIVAAGWVLFTGREELTERTQLFVLADSLQEAGPEVSKTFSLEQRAAGPAGPAGPAGAPAAPAAPVPAVIVEKPVIVEKVVEVERASAARADTVATAKVVSQDVATSDRQVIRNGTLTLMVADPERAVSSIGDLVAGIPGAFVANSEIKPVRDRQPSAITLRIPAAAFDQALVDLKALAVEVLQEQTHAQDVTEEYADLGIQLRNLEAAERQFLVLFERAEKVQDILNIQDRLQRIRGEIERLRGRLNVLENRVALATVRVVLHPPPDLSVELMPQGVPSAHEESAFRLTYRNDGSVRAKDVVVTLSLPEQVSLAGMPGDGTYDPVTRIVTWEISELSPGQRGTFAAVVQLGPAARSLVLEAAIQASTTDADGNNNVATARLTFEPDLMVEINGPSAVARGDTATLIVWYANDGTGDAEEASIRLSLPVGVTFVRAAGGRYDADDHAIVWDLGRVRAHDGNQREARVRVDVEAGRLALAAVITAAETERVTYNNRTEAALTALREDFSDRTVWSPGQTFRDSLDALGEVARGAVNVLIWVGTFAVPLAVLAGLLLVPIMLIRRWRAAR